MIGKQPIVTEEGWVQNSMAFERQAEMSNHAEPYGRVHVFYAKEMLFSNIMSFSCSTKYAPTTTRPTPSEYHDAPSLSSRPTNCGHPTSLFHTICRLQSSAVSKSASCSACATLSVSGKPDMT